MTKEQPESSSPTTELAWVQAKAAENLLANAAFWGAGVVVVILLAEWKRWLGITGFGLFCLIVAFDVLQGAAVVFSSCGVVRDLKSQGSPTSEWAHVRRATLIRALDDIVSIAYVVFLYYWLFQRDA